MVSHVILSLVQASLLFARISATTHVAPNGVIVVHQPVAVVCSDTTSYEIRTTTIKYTCPAAAAPTQGVMSDADRPDKGSAELPLGVSSPVNTTKAKSAKEHKTAPSIPGKLRGGVSVTESARASGLATPKAALFELPSRNQTASAGSTSALSTSSIFSAALYGPSPSGYSVATIPPITKKGSPSAVSLSSKRSANGSSVDKSFKSTFSSFSSSGTSFSTSSLPRRVSSATTSSTTTSSATTPSATASSTTTPSATASSATTSPTTTSTQQTAIPSVPAPPPKKEFKCDRFGHLIGMPGGTFFPLGNTVLAGTIDTSGGGRGGTSGPVRRHVQNYTNARRDSLLADYFKVDLVSAKIVEQKSIKSINNNLNALCYNEKDNFLYATDCAAVVRIDQDLKLTQVAALPSADCADKPTDIAPGLADCKDGFMHIRSKDKKWRVDLQSFEVVGPFPYSRPNSIADIAIFNGKVYGVGVYPRLKDKYGYAPSHLDVCGSGVYEEENGLVYDKNVITSWKPSATSAFGGLAFSCDYTIWVSVFLTKEGILYAGNSNGQLWRIDPQTRGPSSSGDKVGNWKAYFGDGARCALAPEKQVDYR
ncbi:hypothetical protein NLG97_g223 [Lecanicillium saksenae]|uniref:Uncharacterized protein n=1 Tax=Lecanicillium saksenae TaxID=468837 RepID=A0ACC1R775_9HYPO|nr:hypothetical protein NLG97_g223 [Lecanicillium saksenae]